MNIFNFLMRTFHEKVTGNSAFPLIILAAIVTGSMSFFMSKRYKKYFEDRSQQVQKELGPPKYKMRMKVNVFTESMIDETFVITGVYINHGDKFYMYDLEDVTDGTEYSKVPEKFLCPLAPEALAVNNVSFSELMAKLTAVKKTHHDIAW